MQHAIWLANARQRRADYLGSLVRCNVRPGFLFTSGITVLASVALVVAYTTLLAHEGVPTSALELSAVLLAATLSSVAGFAFSAVCGAMLLHMMSDSVQAVMIMMVCSIAIQSLSVVMLWRDIDWRNLLTFLIGGAIGLPVGVWLLLYLGNIWFKEAIGGLLMAYSVYGLLRRPLTIRTDSPMIDVFVGVIGGITGGLAGFPGAAVTIWCGTRGWDKRRQRAVYQPFILIMQVVALLLIQVFRSTGMPTGGAGLDILQFIPAALLGAWLGLAIFKRLSDRHFAMTVNLLLLVSGIGLLV